MNTGVKYKLLIYCNITTLGKKTPYKSTLKYSTRYSHIGKIRQNFMGKKDPMSIISNVRMNEGQIEVTFKPSSFSFLGGGPDFWSPIEMTGFCIAP